MARPITKGLAAAACLLLAIGAGVVAKTKFDKEKETHRDAPEDKKIASKKTPKKKRSARQNAVQLNRKLSEMTGGKQVKAVWVESLATDSPDPHAKTKHLRLVGLDNEDEGYRVIRENAANYARPLITPDGHLILYTDKGTAWNGNQISYNPKIHVVDWEGEHDEVLLSGFCVHVARDPQTGKTMVYALETLNPKTQPTLDGERLFRFPLDQPHLKEPLWDKTSLSVDNLQFSRDGKVFCGLFPWPEGGVGDVTKGTWHKTFNGCWSSIAPDNSYLTWIFSGSHTKVRFDDLRSSKKWEVKISQLPGLNGAQVYHPRWSNHPLFFSMTGPYSVSKKVSNTKSGSKSSAPMVASGSAAEVYVGRFAPSMDKVDGWAKLSANAYGDFQPDVWIAEGDEAVLAQFPQAGGAGIGPAVPAEWPGVSSQLLYVWQDADAMNEIEGRHMSCNAEAHGVGRFGRSKDMILDGGWFETDDATTTALNTELATAKGVSMELLLSENREITGNEAATIFTISSAEGKALLAVTRTKEAVIAKFPASTFSPKDQELKLPLPFETNGAARHLMLSMQDTGAFWSLAGSKVKVPGNEIEPLHFDGLTGAKLTFGETNSSSTNGNWSAHISNIALYKRALTDREIQTHAKLSRAETLPEAGRVRLKARLVEATSPDPAQLGSYKRMLIDHTYEVTQVLEGEFKDPKVIALHWAMLDQKLVPGFPRELDMEYELVLEPEESHPEISSELQLAGSSELEVKKFLDVQTPAPLVK